MSHAHPTDDVTAPDVIALPVRLASMNGRVILDANDRKVATAQNTPDNPPDAWASAKAIVSALNRGPAFDRLVAETESRLARVLKDGDPFDGDDWEEVQRLRGLLALARK